MHYKNLVETIKERRESLRLNQQMLSDLSDVSLRTIKQFESGKGNPTIETLRKIADVLGFELCLTLKKMPAK